MDANASNSTTPNKRKWLIIGGIVAAVLLCICVAVVGFGMAGLNIFRQASQEVVEGAPTEAAVQIATAISANSPEEAAQTFLDLLGSNRYDQAVAMMTADLRSDPTTGATLKDIVETKQLDPKVWTWTDQLRSEDGSEAYFTGTVTYENQTSGPIELQARQEDGVWRVFYLDLKTDGTAQATSGVWQGWSEAEQQEQVAMAQGSADAFLSLWMSGETDAAYELTTQEMKDSLGGVDGMGDFFTSIGATPESWEWDGSELIDIGSEYPVVELTGSGVFTAGQRAPVRIQLEWVDGMWLVRYININNQ